MRRAGRECPLRFGGRLLAALPSVCLLSLFPTSPSVCGLARGSLSGPVSVRTHPPSQPRHPRPPTPNQPGHPRPSPLPFLCDTPSRPATWLPALPIPVVLCLLPECGLPEARGLAGIPSGGAHAQERACPCRRPTDGVHGPSLRFCTALLRTPVVLPACLRSLGALHSPPHSLCPLSHQLGLCPLGNAFLSF